MFDLLPFENRNRSLARFFDNFDKEFFSNTLSTFKTDVLDKGDRYVLQAELPGFNREEIHVDVQNNCLTISAQHNEEKEQKEENYLRRERSFGSYVRSFDLSGVQVSNISAEYKNGVLEVSLPKLAKVEPEKKQIEIK